MFAHTIQQLYCFQWFFRLVKVAVARKKLISPSFLINIFKNFDITKMNSPRIAFGNVCENQVLVLELSDRKEYGDSQGGKNVRGFSICIKRRKVNF